MCGSIRRNSTSPRPSCIGTPASSGHCSGRRQAGHAHIFQIILHMTQSCSLWTPPRRGSTLSARKNPMGGILNKELSRMPMEVSLAIPDYAGDISQPSPSEYQLIRHIVLPTVTKHSAKQKGIKRVQTPFQLVGQSPGLTGVQQVRQDKRAKNAPGSSQSLIDF